MTDCNYCGDEIEAGEEVVFVGTSEVEPDGRIPHTPVSKDYYHVMCWHQERGS